MITWKIAITGTHGTGKTTFARALSAHTGLPLITEQARLVAAEMNLVDCDQLLCDPNLAKAFQERVLERQIAEQLKHPEGFIADRSTLDAIAYYRLYLGNANGSEDPDTKIDRYIYKARLHAWKGLDLLVYIPPVILGGEEKFRLKGYHIEVDLFIRREVKLLQENRRVQVVVLKSKTLDGRLAEVEQVIGRLAAAVNKGHAHTR